MKQRIITGLIGGVAVLLILFASNVILINLAVALISICALSELCSVMLNSKSIFLKFVAVVFGVIYYIAGVLNYNYIIPLLFITVITFGLILIFSRSKINVYDLNVILFAVVYIILPMIHIPYTRELTFGKYNLFLIIVGACTTDIFAYFTGTLFGRHKLCPNISPKKTIEGAIGGVLGAVLSLIITAFVVFYMSYDVSSVNYFSLIILGVISAIFAQLGDLTASSIKRQFQTKDYGNILPGHGGFMDRIDSIIFVAPLVYYFVLFFPIFN